MAWARLFEPTVYSAAVALSFILAAGAFVALLFVPAPYGRHARRGWGRAIPARWAWLAMEAPAALIVAAVFFIAGRPATPAALALFGLWQLHYLYRALVYPMLLSPAARALPAAVPAMAIGFHLLNGYLQGGWLFFVGPVYPDGWFLDPRFLAGAALFLAGLAVNTHSDAIFRELRRPGESGYQTPRGGLFRWVSCPNYLGEIVEWTGWALATWSPAGAAFALWTIANLAPRARSHHRWYRDNLPDYPRSRRALLPGLW